MKVSHFPDPFEEVRASKGLGYFNDQDDPVDMVLRLKDVRKCAHHYKIFKSGAVPGRIVVPSEVNIRNTRQIPFELDPPEHTAYRAILEEWFKRPLNKNYQDSLEKLVQDVLSEVEKKGDVDVVKDFALKLQSRALTLLLNVPLEESEKWISWGTHVFRSQEDPLDANKAEELYQYLDEKINYYRQHPGEDMYSLLLNARVNNKALSHDEIKGVMILTFAGGRDTVINAITNTIAYFADHPESLDRIKKSPELLSTAVEELIRYFAPLTHMGRVVTEDTEICNHKVKENSRISLCWASANRDPQAFEKPNEVVLDRKINPHVSFGFSHHKCLGATQARQILKILIQTLVDLDTSILVKSAKENIEDWGDYNRKVGFDKLIVEFK